MVYQEQVMQMAQIIGGYSLGGADLLRRAMGKKKPEEMAQHRQIFREGAAKNGLTESKADELFDLMEKFAGYGFNKSHAAAYALVAYHTAYMKAHHAAAFMAANMSAVMADTDKVQQLFDDAVQNGLTILPPDVNASGYRFVPLDTKSIRYGLGAIKGSGEGAIAHIVDERTRNGPFKDLFDFCHRVDKRLVNRRTVESLVRSGAFDSVNDHRASLLASVGIALESAEQASRDAQQVSLFGGMDEPGSGVSLVTVPRWNDLTLLQHEKSALGFYLSGHPFRTYEPELRGFIPTRLDQVEPRSHPVLLAGIMHSLRIQMTRRGRMAVILLDDGNARIELTVFNELFEQHRHWLKEDQLLIVEGKVAYDEFSGSVRISAEKVFDLQTARNRFARGLRITCNGASSGAKLREVLAPYRSGNCPVQIVYYTRGATCEIELGDEWRVNLHDDLINSLAGWLKPENVQVLYTAQARVLHDAA
jgi:DNA polymerase-3 subunit alpha